MPGLHVVHDPSGGLAATRARFEATLGSLLHEDGFTAETLHLMDGLAIARSVHPSYPVETFRSGRFLSILEGILYGKDHAGTAAALERLAGSLFAREKRNAETVRWLLETDGDFVILVIDTETSELRIVNDALGRLPLYIAREGTRTIVSRELRFVTGYSGKTGFDRTALAQYLLLGYPLGDRTLFDGVSRCPPSSIISGGPHGSLSLETVHRFDLEAADGESVDLDAAAAACVDLFIDACRRRAATEGQNVLTLSGGLDSRAVAAGMNAARVPFSAATFLDHQGTAAEDISPARLVAETHGIDWRLFRLGPATGADALTLLRTKSGMNHLGMSFSIPYFRRIREAWGSRITYFTGEGGGNILPDLRPVPPLRTDEELARRIIEVTGSLPLRAVSDITGIEPGSVAEGITAAMRSCPESDPSMRYLHFLLFERVFKWAFEGEDRNRFFFWTVTPFFSIDFFAFAIRCPLGLRKRHRLYRRFLRLISPVASRIVYPAWRLPVSSPLVPLYFIGKSVHGRLPRGLRSAVRTRWKGHSGGYAVGSHPVRCLMEQIERCPAVADVLSVDAVRRAASHSGRTGFDHLFTVTSLIEYASCGSSTLEGYGDTGLL